MHAMEIESFKIETILFNKSVDQLKPLANFCGRPDSTRKADLVYFIINTLTTPSSLKRVWDHLDTLSKKVVAAAYHNDGELNLAGFIAQYGSYPERTRRSTWAWHGDPIRLDLFIYNNHVPEELMPLLGELVPPPERFQLVGLQTPPPMIGRDGHPYQPLRADTEQIGQHDLLAYLRLVEQGHIKISSTTSRATLTSIKKIKASLLAEDFFPPEEKVRASETIRPFGLDVFAQESGLAGKVRGENTLKLTSLGQAYFKSRDPDLLLQAFERWVEKGSFDELSRISGLKGLKAKGTRLTPPASRREPAIEALSWCPVGTWIDIKDFYRAVKIWDFDFEVETTYYSNLYVGYREYGGLHGDNYWMITKGLYINALIMEYMAVIGAVDIGYIEPELGEYYLHLDYYDYDTVSRYDGLKYFRINAFGAFLLGQAGEYAPATVEQPPLFKIGADDTVTLTASAQLTPNDRHFLEQLAVRDKHGRYRLDTGQLLTALETGADLAHLTEFLTTCHDGPLPGSVQNWLAHVEQNTQAFKLSGQALLIKANSAELAAMAAADPTLKKICQRLGQNTLVVPANREKQFRARLMELEYILGE